MHCSARFLPMLALAGAAFAAEASPERVVIVARVGKLAEAEVSPSPQLKVPALWKLALEGVSLTRVEPKGGARAPNSIEELRLALLPDEPRAETVDWKPRSSISGDSGASLKVLESKFGAPPPPTQAEKDGVNALQAALGSSRGLEPGRSPAGGATTTDLSWLARSSVTLVRVDAGSSTVADVVERDELVQKITESAGLAANIIVVNLPEVGAGTVIARGPRLKRARVNEKPRSVAAVKGMVSLFLDPTAGEKYPAIKEELVHELFK